MYGPRAAHPTQIVMKDWTSEQWSRGCYVAVMNTGVLSAYGEGNYTSLSPRAEAPRAHGTATAFD